MRALTFTIYALLFISNHYGQEKNDITFQANIENQNWEYLYIKDQDYNTVQILNIDTTGTCTANLTIPDGMYLLFDGVEYFKIYLKKGYDLQLSMNTNNYRETIHYSGIGAIENNFLAQENLLEVDFDYGSMSHAKTTKKTFKLIEEKEKSFIQRIQKTPNLDSDFVKLETESYKKHSEDLRKYYGELREMNL